MQLHHVDFTFTLLTPCFSGTALGKHDDHAEMRVPPIRGHVRFWHRALFNADDANRVWGSTNGNDGHGSRVALRLIAGPLMGKYPAALLPHDPKKSGKDRPSLRNGEVFTLRLQRLVGCTNDDWNHGQRAVKTWLLLGCLGLRSNRAAGSVWPIGDWVPRVAEIFKITLQTLGLTNWSVAAVALGTGKDEAELRKAASDTLDGFREVFGGIKPQRKPSPTKFKVIRFGEAFCLLAMAPARQIAGHGGARRTILQEAEQLLKDKPQPARWQALGPWQHLLP